MPAADAANHLIRNIKEAAQPLLIKGKDAMVPVILSGSLRLGTIVQTQADHHWFLVWPFFIGVPAFLIFLLAMLAEANRIPFDIPEAESELVAGVTTEYTGMKFAIFKPFRREQLLNSVEQSVNPSEAPTPAPAVVTGWS